MKYSAFNLLRNAISHNTRWEEAWRSPEPKREYDAIIVGGGGHGLATAYYLAKEHGVRNVAVLEKGWIGGGNTGRNTTIVRSNYLWTETSLLYEKSMQLWEGLSQDLNYNVMFSQRGVYNLGHTLQDMRDIERRVNANRLNGIDAEVVTAAQIKKAIPNINTSPDARYPILGASLQPRAGVARHDARNFASVTGHGVRAEVSGHDVLVGADRLMAREGLDIGALVDEERRLAERPAIEVPAIVLRGAESGFGRPSPDPSGDQRRAGGLRRRDLSSAPARRRRQGFALRRRSLARSDLYCRPRPSEPGAYRRIGRWLDGRFVHS